MSYKIGQCDVIEQGDGEGEDPNWGKTLEQYGKNTASMSQGTTDGSEIGTNQLKIAKNPKTGRWAHWQKDTQTANEEWRMLGELGSEYTDYFVSWDAMGGFRYQKTDGTFIYIGRISPTGSGHSTVHGDYEDKGYLASKEGTYLSWVEGDELEVPVNSTLTYVTSSTEMSFIPSSIATMGLISSFTLKRSKPTVDSIMYARMTITRESDGKIYYETMTEKVWNKQLTDPELKANNALEINMVSGSNNVDVAMPVRLPILMEKGVGDANVRITIQFREKIPVWEKDGKLNRIERSFVIKQDKAAGEDWVKANILPSVTDNRSVGIGNSSLVNQTTGEKNISVGTGSGKDITTGSDNIFLGDNAGHGVTTGENNILLGSETHTDPVLGTDDQVVIGNVNNHHFRLGNQNKNRDDRNIATEKYVNDNTGGCDDFALGNSETKSIVIGNTEKPVDIIASDGVISVTKCDGESYDNGFGNSDYDSVTTDTVLFAVSMSSPNIVKGIDLMFPKVGVGVVIQCLLSTGVVVGMAEFTSAKVGFNEIIFDQLLDFKADDRVIFSAKFSEVLELKGENKYNPFIIAPVTTETSFVPQFKNIMYDVFEDEVALKTSMGSTKSKSVTSSVIDGEVQLQVNEVVTGFSYNTEDNKLHITQKDGQELSTEIPARTTDFYDVSADQVGYDKNPVKQAEKISTFVGTCDSGGILRVTVPEAVRSEDVLHCSAIVQTTAGSTLWRESVSNTTYESEGGHLMCTAGSTYANCDIKMSITTTKPLFITHLVGAHFDDTSTMHVVDGYDLKLIVVAETVPEAHAQSCYYTFKKWENSKWVVKQHSHSDTYTVLAKDITDASKGRYGCSVELKTGGGTEVVNTEEIDVDIVKMSISMDRATSITPVGSELYIGATTNCPQLNNVFMLIKNGVEQAKTWSVSSDFTVTSTAEQSNAGVYSVAQRSLVGGNWIRRECDDNTKVFIGENEPVAMGTLEADCETAKIGDTVTFKWYCYGLPIGEEMRFSLYTGEGSVLYDRLDAQVTAMSVAQKMRESDFGEWKLRVWIKRDSVWCWYDQQTVTVTEITSI